MVAAAVWVTGLVVLLSVPGCSENEKAESRAGGDAGDAGGLPDAAPADASFEADVAARCRHTDLGISYPPVTDSAQRTFAAEHLAALGAKRIRFSEHWSYREKAPGVYKWNDLDERLQWAQDQGVRVFLNVEPLGPEWACDPDKTNDLSCVFREEEPFQKYIQALVERHGASIDAIQFGNEWVTTYWYVGTAEDFVRFSNIVYDAVQAIRPELPVVLGGLQTAALRFLSACEGHVDAILFTDEEKDEVRTVSGGELADLCASSEFQEGRERVLTVLHNARYDQIDLHLYEDAEQWASYAAALRSPPYDVTAPFVVSEFGGPHMWAHPYSDAYHAERLGVYLETIDGLGVEAAYYFKLVESESAAPWFSRSGLIDQDLEQKPGYSVFAEFQARPRCEGE